MLLCYLTPITLVYSYYNSNASVSSIICNEECRNTILGCMFLMGVGTITYEIERQDTISTFLISLLLIGIYGLICIDESSIIHYIFAFFGFAAILLFMIWHCYRQSCNLLLFALLLFEVATFIYLLINIENDIFVGEVVYILIFAIFYLYLHFCQR